MNISRNIKPTESGYADVNGLKMYYEVYGNQYFLVYNLYGRWKYRFPR
jgi:hypothetical protein